MAIDAPLRRTLALLAVLSVAALPVFAGAGTVELEAAGHRLTAERAITPEEQQLGLMHRHELPADHGMLFIYREPGLRCMWMKDTPIALDVAFLDEQGRILNIAGMQPHSLQPHCSAAPARFALEMAGGWFARHGIAPGMRIRGIEQAAQAP